MPYYPGLKQIKDAAMRKRTIAGLQRLRPALVAAIPPRTATDTLLLATWNIREFDAGQKATFAATSLITTLQKFSAALT